MWKIDTYSKRLKKQQQKGKGAVYQYDTLPQTFRVQVIYIWTTAIGIWERPARPLQSWSWSSISWGQIHDSLARELGEVKLSDGNGPFEMCQKYLLTADTEGALDIIDWTFKWIDSEARKLSPYARQSTGISQEPDDAIAELNHRFREHAIGYQFEGGKILRVDSEYIHSEVVKPAIELLNVEGFRGASEEFLKAHEHYRNQRNKEAINEALKAFESTMKAICDASGWKYPSNATSKTLIDTLMQNGLIPKDLESHFSGLRAAMETGLPTIRNRLAGHGQGAKTIEIPEYLAAYALHLAASNIVFLVEAHRSKK